MKYVFVSLSIIVMVSLIYFGLQQKREGDRPPSTRDEKAEPLSDDEIKAIIDEQRLSRSDLPKPFGEYEWVARPKGNHYVYIEYGLPKAPGYNQIFKLNRHGRIVDATFSEDPSKSIDCPDNVFSKSELAAIVAEERGKRGDLPPPFPNHRTRVERMRCLYMYFEYALPEVPGKHHVFVIDPYGELMEVIPSKP